MKRFLIPLGLFLVLVVFLAVGLNRDPHEVPSPLVGKPAPEFKLEKLGEPGKTFSPADMRGQVWLLNVWASWCVSCRAEHPLLVAFAKQGGVPIVGLNYKEVRGDGETDVKKLAADQEIVLTRQRAAGWLSRHGNPYTPVGARHGRPGRHRLRRVWRAGNLPDRQERRDPLQADRPDHPRGTAAEDSSAGQEACRGILT